MTVGKLIRDRRKARGWSQELLAERLVMKQTYLSRLERDEVGLPQRATLEKIGAELGVSLPEFYRAAGVLEGLEEDVPDAPPSPRPPRDSEAMSEEQMVAFVEANPGAVFQQRRAAVEKRLPRAEYVRFSVRLLTWKLVAWENGSSEVDHSEVNMYHVSSAHSLCPPHRRRHPHPMTSSLLSSPAHRPPSHQGATWRCLHCGKTLGKIVAGRLHEANGGSSALPVVRRCRCGKRNVRLA